MLKADNKHICPIARLTPKIFPIILTAFFEANKLEKGTSNEVEKTIE